MAHILVADDDEILVELVSSQLEFEGHIISVAEDGEAALSAAAQEAPDLVILDSMMPRKTGPEVLRSLRNAEKTRDLPVLMLTARKGEDDVVSGLRAGADDYKTKPFSPQELSVRTSKLLAKSGAGKGNGH